ncbi:hypothetical protein [Sphingomonas sp. MS122]|uniref:hypothetical protein n=1 Tax=Sphingomonas sp. MS122 TaxID=3412683 RepID=UPI003C2AD594
MPSAILRSRMPAPAFWLAAAMAAALAPFLEPFAGWLDPMRTVKLLPVAAAAALAIAFYRLLGALDANRRRQRAAAWLALPLMACHALLLGGTNALQAAACVTAVAMAIERRHAVMFAWWGIAIAFAVQALLLAPFFLALAIRRRISALWLALPVALLAVRLSGALPDLAADTSSSAPNIWSLAAALAPEHAPALLGIALAAGLGAAAAYIARMQSIVTDRAALAGMAALATLLAAGLLPQMGAQDFLLPGILTLALAVARGTRNAFTLAALVQLGTIAAAFGFGLELTAAGTLCMIAATWIAAQPLIAPHANDNRDGSHAIPLPHGLRGTLSFDMVSRPAVWPRGE